MGLTVGGGRKQHKIKGILKIFIIINIFCGFFSFFATAVVCADDGILLLGTGSSYKGLSFYCIVHRKKGPCNIIQTVQLPSCCLLIHNK